MQLKRKETLEMNGKLLDWNLNSIHSFVLRCILLPFTQTSFNDTFNESRFFLFLEKYKWGEENEEERK